MISKICLFFNVIVMFVVCLIDFFYVMLFVENIESRWRLYNFTLYSLTKSCFDFLVLVTRSSGFTATNQLTKSMVQFIFLFWDFFFALLHILIDCLRESTRNRNLHFFEFSSNPVRMLEYNFSYSILTFSFPVFLYVSYFVWTIFAWQISHITRMRVIRYSFRFFFFR